MYTHQRWKVRIHSEDGVGAMTVLSPPGILGTHVTCLTWFPSHPCPEL